MVHYMTVFTNASTAANYITSLRLGCRHMGCANMPWNGPSVNMAVKAKAKTALELRGGTQVQVPFTANPISMLVAILTPLSLRCAQFLGIWLGQTFCYK